MATMPEPQGLPEGGETVAGGAAPPKGGGGTTGERQPPQSPGGATRTGACHRCPSSVLRAEHDADMEELWVGGMLTVYLTLARMGMPRSRVLGHLVSSPLPGLHWVGPGPGGSAAAFRRGCTTGYGLASLREALGFGHRRHHTPCDVGLDAPLGRGVPPPPFGGAAPPACYCLASPPGGPCAPWKGCCDTAWKAVRAQITLLLPGTATGYRPLASGRTGGSASQENSLGIRLTSLFMASSHLMTLPL